MTTERNIMPEATATDWRTKLHPIFAECVGSIDGRYSLTRPWIEASYICATDGHIIVRGPVGDLRRLDFDGLSSHPPMLSLTWSRDLYADEPTALPEHPPEVQTAPCEMCDGKGKIRDGRKSFTCEECGGSGADEMNSPIDLGAVRMGDRYIRILMRHGAQLFLPKQKKVRGVVRSVTRHPSYFAVPTGGIEGLLMPLAR